MRTKNPYKINIVLARRSISPSMSSQREYVNVNDTETTGVIGTTGLSCPIDNLGFYNLDADETNVAPFDANETTVAPCDNTNSAIATSSVNPSNKKGKQSKDHNVPANNLRKPSNEVIQILNGLDDSLQLDPTKTWSDISQHVQKNTMSAIGKALE
ncbi:hypothetical protein C2G38_2099789, partial [Gigaspora rosea]